MEFAVVHCSVCFSIPGLCTRQLVTVNSLICLGSSQTKLFLFKNHGKKGKFQGVFILGLHRRFWSYVEVCIRNKISKWKEAVQNHFWIKWCDNCVVNITSLLHCEGAGKPKCWSNGNTFSFSFASFASCILAKWMKRNHSQPSWKFKLLFIVYSF